MQRPICYEWSLYVLKNVFNPIFKITVLGMYIEQGMVIEIFTQTTYFKRCYFWDKHLDIL